MKKSEPVLFCFSLLVGRIILFNGTSSAGKSSLAEVLIQDSEIKYEVVSFDDFYHSYREKHGITWFKREEYQDFLVSLYRHAKARSEAGRNVIIDTVEFDLGRDAYCEILDCPRVIKAIVYCPLKTHSQTNREKKQQRRPQRPKAQFCCPFNSSCKCTSDKHRPKNGSSPTTAPGSNTVEDGQLLLLLPAH